MMIKSGLIKIKKIIFGNKNHHKNMKMNLFFTKDHLKHLGFEIGEYSYGKPTILFNESSATLKIGKFCSIAQNVKIYLGGNHRTDWISTYPFNALPNYFPESSHILGHPATKGDVVIGNDVWIGNDVSVLSGVTIGDGAVIGAGSILSKNVGAYEIWAGNPARYIKTRFTAQQIDEIKKIQWWNWDIKKIKANTELLCSTEIIKLRENVE